MQIALDKHVEIREKIITTFHILLSNVVGEPHCNDHIFFTMSSLKIYVLKRIHEKERLFLQVRSELCVSNILVEIPFPNTRVQFDPNAIRLKQVQ